MRVRRLLPIRLLLLLGFAVGAALATGQGAPVTDIWLAPLDLAASPAMVGPAINVTHRDGYDNQPFFEPEGKGLLFTSQRGEQTDIYRLPLDTRVAAPLTATSESEYSPTIVPGGHEMSVIQVEADGTQRLWGFRRDGSSPQVILANASPVGYHAWTAEGALALFVLGDPVTLQLADRDTGSAEIIAENIGRSLHALPDGSGFSFLQRVDGAWQIKALHLADLSVTDLGAPFRDSQDMAWTPDGRIVMAAGSEVAIRAVDGDWTIIGDLAEAGARSLTRVAIHPDGHLLAVVGIREP